MRQRVRYKRQKDGQNQQLNQSRVAGDKTKASETANAGHKIKRSMTEKEKTADRAARGVRGRDRVRQLILCHGCAN